MQFAKPPGLVHCEISETAAACLGVETSCRPRGDEAPILTLKVTPAMAAGVTDRVWELADMINVLEAWEVLNRL